jgi:hypothetical protein
VAAAKIHELAAEGGMPTPTSRTSRRFATCLNPDFDVEDLIDEFPDQLVLDRITDVGELTYYALDICPMKGEAHRDQYVGMGHSCLIVGGPMGLGFKCLSDKQECQGTIKDLLNKLYAQTGRRYSGNIWTVDLESLAKAWGDQAPIWEDGGQPIWLGDNVAITAALDAAWTAPISTIITTESVPDPIELQTPVPPPTPITITALESIYLQTVLAADDLVGRANQPGQRDFRRVAELIMSTHNHPAMRAALGEDLIADIDEEVRTADVAPLYEDADCVTHAFLTVQTRGDYLARKLKGIPAY